jgi:hypothetical protein
MRTLYDILDNIESRPAMFLGNDCDTKALDHFIYGFKTGGGQLHDSKLNYPDFTLFTDWVGGMLKINSVKSSVGWHWLLKDKFKDDKKAWNKFFQYLRQYKESEPEVLIIPIKESNIEYSINNNFGYLWCISGSGGETYKRNLKKINSIVVYNLKPSRTTFALLLDKKGKVIESRNSDMTGRILLKEIEKQFNISLSKIKPLSTVDSIVTLRKHKVI